MEKDRERERIGRKEVIEYRRGVRIEAEKDDVKKRRWTIEQKRERERASGGKGKIKH